LCLGGAVLLLLSGVVTLGLVALVAGTILLFSGRYERTEYSRSTLPRVVRALVWPRRSVRAGGVVGSIAAGVGLTLFALYLTLLGRFGWFFVACGFTWLVRDLALLAWMKTKPRES